MLDRLLGVASAATFVVGTVAGPSAPHAETAFTFQDQRITESSGLVVADGLAVTTNDSGDSGRVFVVDTATGKTVGVTSWSPDPEDVEALAPAGPGEVWVGDIGDNRRARSTVTVLKVPYGRGDRVVTPTAYELVYPDRAHDAETLLVQPRTGRLFVVSKDVFGGTVYAAPTRLSPDHPNRLRAVSPGFSFATDGTFFPDGRHYVVRGYAAAAVYRFPGHEQVASFRLPAQEQGEGIAVGPDGDLYLSSEGVSSDVLRMPLPRDVRRAMAPPAPSTSASTSPSTSPSASPAEPAAEPAAGAAEESTAAASWPWLAGGAVALVFVVTAAWLLLRRGQAP